MVVFAVVVSLLGGLRAQAMRRRYERVFTTATAESDGPGVLSGLEFGATYLGKLVQIRAVRVPLQDFGAWFSRVRGRGEVVWFPDEWDQDTGCGDVVVLKEEMSDVRAE